MKSDLRILLLEDSLRDACLIEHELMAADLSFQLIQVQTERELRRELEATQPDLILSDHGLPSFDGFAALDIVRNKFPRLPFIFVSGSNDQGMIVDMHEQGATDYIYKREIRDLGPAVRRALTPALETIPTEPEPEMQEVKAPLAKPLAESFSNRAQLLFCPQCLQARDESGALIQLADRLKTDVEIVFLRKPCLDCDHSPQSNSFPTKPGQRPIRNSERG